MSDLPRLTPIGPVADIFVGPIYAAMPSTDLTFFLASRAYAAPFRVSQPTTVSTVHFSVGVQNGNLCIAVLASNGDRLATTGSFATPAAGYRTQALGASVALSPGLLYYAAIASDSLTVALGSFGYGSNANRSLLEAIGMMKRGSETAFPIAATNTLLGEAAKPYAIAFT